MGRLELDPLLSKAAQDHSVDMINRNYFSHTSPNGEGPEDRVLKYGLGGAILAENIAIASTIYRAHISLKNSPGHFRNTVGRDYTRIGVGLALDQRGQYYVTVLFSVRNLKAEPLTVEEVLTMKGQIISEIQRANPSVYG